MKKYVSILAMTAAVIMSIVGAAYAVPTTYSDRTSGSAWSDWYNAGSSRGFYSYNYQPFTTPFNFGPTPVYDGLTKTFAPVPVGGLDMGTVNATVTTNNGFSGAGMLQTTALPGTNTVKFVFEPQKTWAVGGIWDLGNYDTGYSTGLTVTLLLADNTSFSTDIVQDAVTFNQPEFWGWTSDVSILAVEVSTIAAGAAQGFSLQQLEYQAVPEPSTFALVGLGIGGLAFLRRRK